MALSYGVTDYIEGGVITAVIMLNVLIGFYQEFQAGKEMESLRSLSSPSAAVLRDGHLETVPSADVVPGDVVQIRTGDTIPADMRLIDAMNLECDEKILTGEAVPVAKDANLNFVDGDEVTVGVGDRLNMAYSSSTVTRGRGTGIVVFTGMFTEIMRGKPRKVNRSMSQEKGSFQPVKGAALLVWDGFGAFLGLTTGTPLQRKLSKLAYTLFGCALLLAIIVFGVNRFHVTNEVAIYAISIGTHRFCPLCPRELADFLSGIAIIPESLIAVLTITMVVGMTQMRKRRVVIRQLSALEALGGVTNICSDKTGTLTQGQMITRKVWLPDFGIYTVEGADDASDPTRGTVKFTPWSKELGSSSTEKAETQYVKTAVDSDTDFQKAFEFPSELERFLQSTALCNLAMVHFDSQKQKWQSIGDPTEIALQVFSCRFGHGKKTLKGKTRMERARGVPF